MGWGKLRAVTVNRYVVYMNVPVQHVVVTLRAGVATVVKFVVNIFMQQSMILYKQLNDINADTPEVAPHKT